jgi:hypothetical protein
MSYAQGQSIAAQDYNTFTGGQNPGVAFASSAAAAAKVSAILGVGYGDRGYGQSTPLLPAQSSGGSIKAADWLNLRTALANIASHQGTSTALLPPASDFVAGAPIKAEASSTTSYDFATLISNVDANRFNTNSGASMTLTANSLVSTRTGNWGAGNSGITTIVTVTFDSEDSARFFFNTGGELRFLISHPSGGAQDTDWNTALLGVGTISFKANSTTRSGSRGSPANIGYYQLTTSDQSIVSGLIGSGAYSANTINVSAKAASITGLNGAKGKQIIFTVTLFDSHSNAYADVCSSGTSLACSHLRSSSIFNVSAATYSYSLTQDWT